MELRSHSEGETIETARQFASRLQAPCVIGLRGNLGAGKTVFARSLIRALTNPHEEVPSPTFTLVQIYDTAKGPLWHFDLYRLKSAEEIYELGWEDAVAQGIVLVEWPERLGTLTLPNLTLIDFQTDPKNPEIRIIRISQITQNAL